MQPSIIKQKAISLREKGYSYGMIKAELGLSKSTLSDWLKEIPYTPNKEVSKRIGAGRIKSGSIRHNQKIINIKETKRLAKEELGRISERDLWMLGIGLYFGEGAKSNETIRVINSDPGIIKIAIQWFKKNCKLNNKNFIPRIHLYPDINIKQAISFWSKKIRIPESQFAKTQVDYRTNKSQRRKGKLPYGTLCLQVKSWGDPKFGRTLHRRIMGWLEEALRQINKAGVV